VQSIANQTVRLASDPSEFAASFSGRIRALARTHDILTRNSWQGADVMQLLRDQLLLNDGDDDRIALSGPSLSLDPPPALHLALVLHELGTNARKYGSLSVPEGRLSVSWEVMSTEANSFLLLWQETGGPPVQVPSKRGFGTKLIEKSLAAHGGEASIHYRGEGVSCEIRLPLPDSAETADRFVRSLQATTSPGSLHQRESVPGLDGKRVLVVEDEMLIAMDIASMLSEAGCLVVGPAATMEKAHALIAEGGFDVALLDANLAGQRVDGLAAELTRRGIPFAFVTGYEREGLPAAFGQAPMINKPFTRDDALGIVARLTDTGGTVIPIRQKDA